MARDVYMDRQDASKSFTRHSNLQIKVRALQLFHSSHTYLLRESLDLFISFRRISFCVGWEKVRISVDLQP
jgi:hypothetical protein